MSQINQHQITTSLKIKRNNQTDNDSKQSTNENTKMNKTETTLKKIIINQIKNKIMKNSKK